jgi:hypothetical protein
MTKFAFMKFGILMLLALCKIGIDANAQNLGFVRVFDPNGEKIAKGYFVAATDTSLRLELRGIVKDWPASEIALVKTKRAGGNNLALGAAIGTMAFTFLAVVVPDNGALFGDSGGVSVINGAVNGIVYGAAIGGLTIFAKKSQLFFIGGKGENLKALEDHLVAEQNDLY